MRKLAVILIGVLLAANVLASTQYVVKHGDSLWGVANSHKPATVTVAEMIKVIRQQNPSVFVGNSNMLRIGERLTVPTTITEVNAALGKTSPGATILAQQASRQVSQLAANRPTQQSEQATIAQLKRQLANVQQHNQSLQQQVIKVNNQLMYAQQAQQQVATANTTHSGWGWFWFCLWALTVIAVFFRRRLFDWYIALWRHIPAPKWPNWSGWKPSFNVSGWLGGIIAGFNKRDSGNKPKKPSRREPTLNKSFSTPAAVTDSVHEFEQVSLFDDLPEPTQQDYQVHVLEDPKKSHLIDKIRDNPDNTELHVDLLKHYALNELQEPFDRHVKQMLRDRLMQEGDALWGRIRKIYLNTWVYDLA